MASCLLEAGSGISPVKSVDRVVVDALGRMSVGEERDFVDSGGIVTPKAELSRAAVHNDVAEPTSAATCSDFPELYPGPSDPIHAAMAEVPAPPQPVGPRTLPDALEGSHVEGTALGSMEFRPEATNAASDGVEAPRHQSAGDVAVSIGIMSASLRAPGERHTCPWNVTELCFGHFASQ